MLPSSSSPSSKSSFKPRITLMTLGRGDGLLGMRPQGKMGPRGDSVSCVQIDWCYSTRGGELWQTPAPRSILGARPSATHHLEDRHDWIERDLAAEADAVDRIWSLGLVPVDADKLQWRHPDAARELGSLWTLRLEESFADFWAEIVPRLRKEGWTIMVRPGFAHESVAVQRWRLNISPHTGELLSKEVAGDLESRPVPVQELQLARREGAWMLSLGVEIDGVSYDLAPMIANLLERDTRWLNAEHIDSVDDLSVIQLRAPGGKRIDAPAGPIKAIVRTMVDIITDPTRRQKKEGEPFQIPDWDNRRIEALRIALLDVHRVASRDDWQLLGDAGLEQLAKRLDRQGAPQTLSPPDGLGITLRDYQVDGLAWLQYLRAQHLGGILADEMGLGKTVQVLAHILVEKQAGRLTHPALIVMPTSLIFNWLDEAARVTPQLRILAVQGPGRAQLLLEAANYDIVLTTYPLVWRDVEALCLRRWHLLILDEAQMVKNAGSRTARALRRIRAEHLLCMTGTPMENHLGELWAQFDFLMPGFLGDPHSFGRRWRKPIEENGETVRAALLAKRVAPFILRRRKQDVAKELPPRTEMLVRVELQGRQRKLYEAVRTASDQQIRRLLKKQDWGNTAQIEILDALLKLRQVCCDPRLLKGTSVHPDTERAKLEHLAAMLPDLVAANHKLLVFSQFTSMLGLTAELLDSLAIPYAVLTGQTDPKERAAVVARFQSEGSEPILLVSLKAGGTGLNLTAADTVIHLDPWWNPAVQEQASSRAHRIGQKQPVFIYKIVVQGSIEERMLELQARKLALAQGVLGSDAAGAVKFSADELAGLLAPLIEPSNNPLAILAADTKRWGGTGRRSEI